MNKQRKLQEAKNLASAIHKDDDYDGNPYYKGHLCRCEKMLDVLIDFETLPDMGLDVLDVKCAIYLHDIIEDHPDEVDYDDLASFGEDVVEAVRVVTKTDEDGDYAEYIIRILSSDNYMALCVKYVDLAVNIETTVNKEKLNSYEKGRVSRYKLAVLLLDHKFVQMKEGE